MVDVSSLIDQVTMADLELGKVLSNDEGLSLLERDKRITRLVSSLETVASILLCDRDLNSTHTLNQILDILSGTAHDSRAKRKVEGGTIASLDDFRHTRQTLGHPEMTKSYEELYWKVQERIEGQVQYAALLQHSFSTKPKPPETVDPQGPKPPTHEGN